MASDAALLVFMAAFATLIALPALAAASRRRAMREVSEVAGALSAMAVAVRKSAVCLPMEASLWRRAQALGAPEVNVLQLAHELPNPLPELQADATQRLALRLKRRVAFERKMLARTASGRRRGAVAASIPPLMMAVFHAGGIALPSAILLSVVAIEAFGCWLLWRVARVDI